jgi:hypothetical protein
MGISDFNMGYLPKIIFGYVPRPIYYVKSRFYTGKSA